MKVRSPMKKIKEILYLAKVFGNQIRYSLKGHSVLTDQALIKALKSSFSYLSQYGGSDRNAIVQ